MMPMVRNHATLIFASFVFVVGGFFAPPYTYQVFRIWPPVGISDVPYGFGFPLLIVRTGGFEHAGLWDHFRFAALVVDLSLGMVAGWLTNRLWGRRRRVGRH
jgi:hypothetical protein